MHPISIKQINNSSTRRCVILTSRHLLTHEAAGSSEHLNSSEQQCSSKHLNSSERMNRGGEGVELSRVVSIYIHIQPLKKITHSRGFYPSTNPRTALIETLVISCTIRSQFMASLL